MNESQFAALLNYIDTRIAEKTEEAFGRDSLLEALWKYAEGVAAASKDSKDHYDQAIDRKNELELAVRTAVAQLIYSPNGKDEALNTLRHAIGA